MSVDYEGGYLIHDDGIVRGEGNNAHTAGDLSHLGDYAVMATNAVQATEWEIHDFIHDVLSYYAQRQEDLTDSDGEIVIRFSAPQDPRLVPQEELPDGHGMKKVSPEVWNGMDKKAKSAVKNKRRKNINQFEEERGKFNANHRIVSIADKMREHVFYFPHNMDFRSRIYPIPNDLNPQSSDLSKGLLRFTEKDRIGEEGYFWMGFMVATLWGNDKADKLHPNDRYKYAIRPEFIDMLRDFVEDPYANQGWLDADKPLQFLAMALEWTVANSLPNPYEYLSQLPGNLDGSCNGAQHLSIMMRDPKGASLTNCTDSYERQDLYQEVGNEFLAKLHVKYEEGDHMAEHWLVRINMGAVDVRKLVKRAVMTTPYGVTEYGVADQLIKDNFALNEEGERDWKTAVWLRNIIWTCIGDKLEAGKRLQNYFRDCAIRCAENGKPLVWETPAGFKVTQAYYELVDHRIKTLNTRFIIYKESKEAGLNVKRMATSAPPNVVHSCDAAHLQITVVRMAEAGIKSFSMVHDSFGCPLSKMGLMRDILRDTFVDMYEDDYLAQWKRSVEYHSGVTMPELPERGDFDIQQVRNSAFFFS